jgi:hypothetical protein
MFSMNDPKGGTLFKRREVAESVKKLLGKGISIVKYTTKRGKLKRLSPYRGRWIKRGKRLCVGHPGGETNPHAGASQEIR